MSSMSQMTFPLDIQDREARRFQALWTALFLGKGAWDVWVFLLRVPFLVVLKGNQKDNNYFWGSIEKRHPCLVSLVMCYLCQFSPAPVSIQRQTGREKSHTH